MVTSINEEVHMDDIISDKWYVVSSQGVEAGPFDSYKEAKAVCKKPYQSTMYGAEVIETFGDEA